MKILVFVNHVPDTETKVKDKREVEGLSRRRRECLRCGKRFTTKEMIERAELRVVKKDGKREAFDHNKLKAGVMKAFEKRPVSSEMIDKMLANIQEKLEKKGKEVKTTFIGDLVSKELKKLDKIAYIRFASVYKDFAEIDDFKKEIKELLKN